jgi:hypothetical protein
MRRALASLLVFVMTFALVARGVAAPLMHLHPDVPGPTAPLSAAQHAHNHADCGEAEVSDAADHDGGIAPHAHRGHAKDKSMPFDHGKVCDSNGSCCGPLVLSEASVGVFGLVAVPEPSLIAIGAGVKPSNPDRPPVPRLPDLTGR